MSDIQELIEMAWTEFHHNQFPFGCEARMKNYAKEAFYAAYKAANNPWIKISDIPEEWKDGRRVDLITVHDLYKGHMEQVRLTDCSYCERIHGWRDYRNISILHKITGKYEATHAMLPPKPPQQKETQ